MPLFQTNELKGRVTGGTEHSWCCAVPGGTGIAVVAILLSKPIDLQFFEKCFQKLQSNHPILRSKLHYNTSTNTYSFITSPSAFIKIKSHDLSSSSKIIQNSPIHDTHFKSIAPIQLILEHELNNNSWTSHNNADTDLLFASSYALPENKTAAVLRLHVAVCDRTTAVSLLRELVGLVKGGEGFGKGGEEEVSLGIESFVPKEKSKKALWARGLDMLGYSMNSFRLTNLKFVDSKLPRCSNVVRFQMDLDHTTRLLSSCKTRGIKLCGTLVAAALIAAQSSKRQHEQQRKYGVVTLTDCRSILDPVLSSNHLGFYHSAILNIHTIKGGEKLWEIAEKTYTTFSNSKKANKHFSDMADLNFLMCRAIENPSLTSSSSLRTSLISVFEDSVIDDITPVAKSSEVGLEDFMGCASVHGIGPSIAIFDTISDGRLDCVCVYPSPLHSREQMIEFVDKMKSTLVSASNYIN